MYDPFPGGAVLRLDAPATGSVDEEIAAIEKQMEALSLRHCELMEAKRVAFAQSRPIPASPNTLTMSTDLWDHRQRAEAEACEAKWGNDLAKWILRYRADPTLDEILPGLCTLALTNYMRNHNAAARHRTMTGPDPLVARSNGYVAPISVKLRDHT